MEEKRRMQELSLLEFTEALAAKTPVPGGGGAAACVAAVGIALGSMTGNYTLGKKKYEAFEEDVRKGIEEAKALREELLAFLDRDAEAFLPLSKAYGIPKEDPERDTVLEAALNGAAEVPLALMRLCVQGLSLMKVFREKGSRLMQSDVSCGVYFLQAALHAASFNVYINTELMKNRDKAAALESEAGALLSEGEASFEAAKERTD
ncbi:MAG: cyclodeaminase/cyclohydrolase family protein [Lachnospiraceae bacterium]|nr:cyclodeaminase/cyclohydrolase family protein [Lachnospiraceae bacterium]